MLEIFKVQVEHQNLEQDTERYIYMKKHNLYEG